MHVFNCYNRKKIVFSTFPFSVAFKKFTKFIKPVKSIVVSLYNFYSRKFVTKTNGG